MQYSSAVTLVCGARVGQFFVTMPTPRVGPTERARRAAVKRSSAATAVAATHVAAASAAADVLSMEVETVQSALDTEEAIALLEET